MRHGTTATLAAPTACDPHATSPRNAGPTVPWLVFSDDWGRHPTSCQHLVRQLLPEQPVVWVNMIGTRRPRLDLATARRGLEKIGQWLRSEESGEGHPENLSVVSPKVWPGFGRGWERRLNRAWLGRQLRPHLADLTAAPIAITTMPTAADLIGVLPVRHWVYYCVDDFSLWPGIDQAAARRLEDRLIDESDVLIAVSEALVEKIERRGRRAHLLTHGVDVDFWSVAGAESSPRHGLGVGQGPTTLEPPYVVFWGLIDRRMDVAVLRRVSESLSEGTVVLVGPQDDPDPAIMKLRRVAMISPMPLASLPALAASAAVLIMPYSDLPVTRAIQPLKLKEYLATGRPVVVRDLPATRDWSDCLDLAGTPEDFAAAVRRRLADGVPAAQRVARARLSAETWEAKAIEFARLVRQAG